MENYRVRYELCPCCCRFWDPVSRQYVQVPYEQMPADLAIELMVHRNGVVPKPSAPPKRKRKLPKRPGGFSDL